MCFANIIRTEIYNKDEYLQFANIQAKLEESDPLPTSNVIFAPDLCFSELIFYLYIIRVLI